MTYAAILGLVSGADDDVATVSTVADLARRHGASARITTVVPPVPAAGWAEAFGGGVFSHELWQAVARANDDARRRLEDLATTIAGQFGMPLGFDPDGPCLGVADQPAAGWAGLVRELPLTDLVVAGPSAVLAGGPWLGVLDEAVMAGRAPTLIARGAAAPVDRPAAVAWDGSLQAGRAARAAVPLLLQAPRTLILQDPTHLDDDERDRADPERLAAYLRRQGVRDVSVSRIKGHGVETLVEAAMACRAGLLVAGAYGHSRLGEAVFGGATRALLEASDGPSLFIAH
ncbi:MAG: universal stress protein [Caulobacter sp.]|nr:universal stress protein [Caulobacter sp.]